MEPLGTMGASPVPRRQGSNQLLLGFCCLHRAYIFKRGLSPIDPA